jgi:solute carrier family 45 protein 1/2/4
MAHSNKVSFEATESPPLSSPRPPRPARADGSVIQHHPKVVSFRRASSPMSIINDQSPLLRPRISTDFDPLLKVTSPIGSDEEGWEAEVDNEDSKSTLFLFLLTLGGLGLQIAWSVETSNGSVSLSPYVMQHGLCAPALSTWRRSYTIILPSQC